HALHVVQLDVGLVVAAAIQAEAGDDRFVEVQADRGLARRGDAADDDLVVAHTAVVDLNGRIQARKAFQRKRLALPDRVAAHRADGGGGVLHGRLALGGGDDDLLYDQVLGIGDGYRGRCRERNRLADPASEPAIHDSHASFLKVKQCPWRHRTSPPRHSRLRSTASNLHTIVQTDNTMVVLYDV